MRYSGNRIPLFGKALKRTIRRFLLNEYGKNCRQDYGDQIWEKDGIIEGIVCVGNITGK